MTTSYDLQRDMIRRTLIGSSGAVLYTLVMFYSFRLGYILIDFNLLLSILSLFWCGHLAMVTFVLRGYSRTFEDPSLTLPHMVWAILFVTLMMYHAIEIRAALMMAYLSILPFGAFRLNSRGYIGVTLFTISCYALALFMLQLKRPGYWVPELEVLIGVTFLVAMLGYSLLGREFSRMRERLTDSNQQLTLALKKIEELAITDELTGLYNRRYLMTMLEQQRALANREGTPFVLAFIDLDHFKNVNDEHGHRIGDQVLQQFARLLQESVREVDIVARYGGEEFVLLLNGIGLETAEAVVERIRTLVERMKFSELQLAQTTSIGITQYRDTESSEDIVNRADELLYSAKQDGRNRIVAD